LTVLRYHDATKHHFNRFARSLGYLDWATQPDPFRRYEGAALLELPRRAHASAVAYDSLFTTDVPASDINRESIGEFLRCSMGLSAWKEHGPSRWALRVNPSSGNLHPTEAWIVHDGRVCHYAPREHALEERCVLDARTWTGRPSDGTEAGERGSAGAAGHFFVALTSIIWREAWKYGERAFRYCQHDTGHAIGALRLAAAMNGWRLSLLPQWSDAEIASLLGLDRDDDFDGTEREEPECIALVSVDGDVRDRHQRFEPRALVEAARGGRWFGRANRLSSDRVAWPAIDEVTAATRYPGLGIPISGLESEHEPSHPASRIPQPGSRPIGRDIVLGRRSALAFDRRGVLRRESFVSMLQRLRPGTPPWDALDWPPHVHLVLFVHRVDGLTPGVYAYLRDEVARDEWKDAMRAEFLWEPVSVAEGDANGLFLLVPIDAGRTANRLSCDQAIAQDGFFSLSMIARFEQPLRERGEWFYRRLFWECGLIGQVLYLEAEAAGARATGIGCYYDEPTHELLGLSGHAWQSLYHFSMGLPAEDTRLTSEPGYRWEEDRS
jgi:SagB-type dehydrogenase family enzyme